MSKPKITTFALAILCFLHIDLAAQPQSKETKAGTSTVSGRVTLKDEPMRGVIVALRQEAPMMTQADNLSMPRARTDENGRFRMTGVAAGRYLISALAPGYVSSGDPVYGQRGNTLIIAEAENIENMDFELKRGGVITGRVTDSNGRPLVEERVELMKMDNSGRPQNFYNNYPPDMNATDDRGIYRIYGLQEGRYLVSTGFSPERPSPMMMGRNPYPKTFHPDVTDQSQAKVIEVSEGSEATGVDIALGEKRKTYAIYGRVVHAESGRTVPGVQLSFGMISPDGRRLLGSNSAGELTDAKGEFQMQGMPPGKYSVSAYARPDQGEDFYSEPAICEITAGDVHEVEVKVRQGSSMSGFVMIEGTNDPAVLMKLPKLQLYFSTRTEGLSGQSGGMIKVGADGSFIAKGVRPGKVVIYSPGGPYGPVRELTMVRVEHNGVPVRDGIDVGSGQNVANVRVVLAYSILTIRGEVRGVVGVLPRGMRLSVTLRRTMEQTTGPMAMYSPMPSGEVDLSSGRFVIENLSPGEYQLQLNLIYSQPGMGPADQRLSKAISDANKREKIVVTTSNQPPVIIVLDLNQQENK